MFDVSTISTYVAENKEALLAKAVLGANTISKVNVQTGIKGAENLNLLSTEVVLGDGAACGWNEAGTSAVSQRVIETVPFKVNMTFCDKELLKTFMNYGVRVAAGQKSLPFEEEFIGDVVKGVGSQMEKFIWQADGTPAYKGMKGFIHNISDLKSGTADVTLSAGQSAKAKIDAVYAAMPAVLKMSSDTRIFVSPSVYFEYIQNLVSANLYHYNPEDRSADEIMIPGTNVRVVAVAGLEGVNDIIATKSANLVFGCDMQNDMEVCKFWYSEDNREFRLAIEWNAGTQVAFGGDNLVWAK